MPGIWGIVSQRSNLAKIDLGVAFRHQEGMPYLKDEVFYSQACLGRHSLDKFKEDKPFVERKEWVACNEGVILNLRDLLIDGHGLDELMIASFEKKGSDMVCDWRGNFCGYIYFPDTNKLILYTDHLACKPVYYFHRDDIFIFSSELKVVAEGMKVLGFTPLLDRNAAYCLLTFGFMLGDITLIEGVRKMPAGSLFICQDGKIEKHRYYRLTSKPYIADNEDAIIEELSRRFECAVRREYQKDQEYGYRHVATLSGGLDSRMNVGYALKCDFKDIQCFTFSESDYLDEAVAKEICRDYGLEFIFYALDNGNYLYKQIDDCIGCNDGLVLYGGSAHLYACMSRLSFHDTGLVHTGQIGDLVLGSYLLSKEHGRVDRDIIEKMAYSTRLIDRLKDFISEQSRDYDNDELFAFYERCINGVFGGYRVIEQYSEFASPFLDIDFLDYAMKVHPKLRFRQEIYIKWMKKILPELSKYVWEKYKLAPAFPYPLRKAYSKMYSLKELIHHPGKEVSMNPFGYWWKSNKVLRDNLVMIFDESMNAQIDNAQIDQSILDDSVQLFREGKLLEKTQAITLLKAAENLFYASPGINLEVHQDSQSRS